MKHILLILFLIFISVGAWSQKNHVGQPLDSLIKENAISLRLRTYAGQTREKEICNELLFLLRKEGGKLTVNQAITIHNGIAHFYAAQSNVAKALHHYKKILAMTDNVSKNSTNPDLLYLGFVIDTLEGNYKDAITKFQQSTKYSDSTLQASKVNAIADLEKLYNVEKKDNDLLTHQKNIILLEKQKQLRQEAMARDKNIKTVTYVLSGLFLVIIFLLFKGYRSRKRAGLAIEEKQQEIKFKNGQLQLLVDEKEWLLKEIHHRVKNNLQIVMSLLNSQSSFLEDEAALTAIRNSQHRVHSMALIHQKLYKSDEFATLHMPEYVNELIEYLKDSFDTKGDIIFTIEVEDIEMDVSQAVPIGLIINESVTNCIKYAFPDKAIGNIYVSLLHSHDDIFILRIADDGVGLPTGFDAAKVKSLGLKLITGLSRDLEGTFSIKGEGGTTISIEFIYKYKLKYQKSVI